MVDREYKKKVVNSCDKSTKKRRREAIKNLVDMIPEDDIETIYKVLIRFVPEDDPLPDEIEAIREAKEDTSPTIPHDAINWD